MLTTLLAFAIILGPVIVFHEFGHFIVAKVAGIFVKTFSVGFGPKLLKFRIGETQYALSAIPLGGYVKMAGDSVEEPEDGAPEGLESAEGAASSSESSGERRVGEAVLYPSDQIPDSEIPEHRYFRNKPLTTRLAVVTAGPFANLVLAFVVMTGVVWHQGQRLLPTTTLTEIAEDSAEADAGLRNGDVLLRVAGEPVTNTYEVYTALSQLKDEPFEVQLRRGDRDTTLVLPGVERTAGNISFPAFRYRPDTRIGLVKKDGPADKAGLQAGDRIIEIAGRPVRYFDELADVVNDAIGKEMDLAWERDGRRMSAVVVPEGEEVLVPGSHTETKLIGRIQIERFSLVMPVSFGDAVREGVARCWFIIRETGRFLGLAISGQASRDAIGGPIRIGQEAGSALRWGPAILLNFMAFLSMNLCILNMLPIPVLDGGHVLFMLIEAVRGEALSTRAQERLLRLGVSALILLMGFVLINDLVRVLTR